MAKVLVADDEHSICEAFAEILSGEGHVPLIASSGTEALAKFDEHKPSVVFLDVAMPNLNGLETLAELRIRAPDLPVILMTARGTVQIATQAMELGAFDYLGKPVELPEIRQLLNRALHSHATEASVQKVAAGEPGEPGEPLGKGPAMQNIFKMMGLLASNDLTVLITGESGSGKELIARGIHRNGKRRERPFIAVNCAAIPEQLLESELFGHEKGSFTGAVQQRIGRFEAAGDGTLFLDEISELPYHLQSKLLRVLQEKTFERIGSDKPIDLRARVIAASNRQLDEPQSDQPFRQDLYHRLNLVHIEIPPLRERTEDIMALALHFLGLANEELDKHLVGIEEAALDKLMDHDWPGNVRELEHTIKRSALLAPGPNITIHDLLLDSGVRPAGSSGVPVEDLRESVRQAFHEFLSESGDEQITPYQQVIEQVEKTLIAEALKMTGDNQVAASNLLGINRTTLRKKLAD